uniref:Ragulator complex protein LAMTOR3 n=1 Tax=Equus asinus TaxID=9793 RepID=A0A9L0K2Z4_EQUAS
RRLSEQPVFEAVPEVTAERPGQPRYPGRWSHLARCPGPGRRGAGSEAEASGRPFAPLLGPDPAGRGAVAEAWSLILRERGARHGGCEDGVPVIKVANDNAPEHALRPGFLSTFALATDQGSKLGLSKNKSIICYYNTYQVVQFNRLPLVVSFIASSNANTGLIVSLEKELAPLFEELRQVVEVS